MAFPLALTAVGFDPAGVAAGSLAALTQTPHIAAGAKVGVTSGRVTRHSMNYCRSK